MEFFKNQGGNMSDRDIGTLLVPRQADWSWVEGLDARPDLQRRVEAGNRALRDYVRSAVEKNTAPGVEAARRGSGTEFFLSRFGCATRQLDALRATDDVARLESQLERCRRIGD